MYSGNEGVGVSATGKQQPLSPPPPLNPSPSFATYYCPPLVSTTVPVPSGGSSSRHAALIQSGAGGWPVIGDAGGGGVPHQQLSMPNLMMPGVSGSSSVNIAQSFRVGGMSDMIDVEQVQVEVKRFSIPNLQAQSGGSPHETSFCSNGASEISSLFPAENSPKLFPGENSNFSGAAKGPTLKRKVEGVFRNSNFDSLSIQKAGLCANSFYRDSGLQSSSGAYLSLPQQHSLFPGVGSDSSTNFCFDSNGGNENQEADTLKSSWESSMNNPLFETLFPCRKRKVFRQSQTSSMSWSAAPNAYGTKNNYFQSLSDHVFQSWEQNSSGPVQIPRPVVPSYHSQVPQSGYHVYSGENMLRNEDKDIEQKGWIKILQKELRNSDVSSLGRIVLPKKDAEANLPPLLDKDGMNLQMLDIYFPIKWEFKYRFWPNNKSRMYIMENTGDFIKAHKLQTSDFLIIYRDLTCGNYRQKEFPASNICKSGGMEKHRPRKSGSRRLQCSALSDHAMKVNQQQCQNQKIDFGLTSNFSIIRPGADSFQKGLPLNFVKEPTGSSQFPPQYPELETDYCFQT